MKFRVVSIAVLALAAAGALAANQSTDQRGKGQERMDRMAILLDLNDSQKADVQRVLTEQMQERRDAFKQAKESGTRPTREEMRAKHEQMRQATLDKLRPILSEQQMTKFQVLTEHRKGGWHHGRRGGRHGGHHQAGSTDQANSADQTGTASQTNK